MVKKLKKIIKILFNIDNKIIESDIRKFTIMSNSVLSGKNIIGDYTYIGFNCIITKSFIGRYCSIANNVSVGIGEHKINRVSTSSLFYHNPFETLTELECIIGNDVWIGSNSVIRRGIKIGNGAVIGANSFVNRDVGEFEIFAGTPAKKIRNRFSQEKINLINKSNWWSYNFDKACNAIHDLENLDNFEKDSN
jgi:acetyltransferase-like isoleucine patch superfamily enzyme